MRKTIKNTIKVIIYIICCFIGLILLVNLIKIPIYYEYYSLETEVCTNPGLNDGFIPQGIAVVDENTILTCGYMDDKTPSRIYIIDVKNNKSKYVSVYINEEPSTGHFGGIAYSNGKVYVANGSKIQEILLEDLLQANETINLNDGIKMMHKVSYCFADDNYLYVGEFYDDPDYLCEHEIKTPTGTNYALCTAYALSDLTTPVKTYSIPAKVQGFAINSDGNILLSTSRGVNDSKYMVYKVEDQINSNETYLELPLTVLDQPSYEFTGPAMSEDLSVYNDKFYCLTESASNKYVFGKFFFAYDIYYLDIE